MDTTTCIYCMEEKPISDFNREHVLPQAFGRFQRSLVLQRTVCQSCNQYFGDHLDLILTRDSYEAIQRLDHGIKPASKARDLLHQRIEFRTVETGVWGGVRFRLNAEGGVRICQPLPQVGIRRAGETVWTYLTKWELQDTNRQLPIPAPGEGSIHVLGEDQEECAELVQLLADRGITFNPRDDTPAYPYRQHDDLDLEATFAVDQILMRSIAKIAFNYLTAVTDSAFVRQDSFNALRQYIRWGTPVTYPVVDVSDRPILLGDTQCLRQTDGHLLTVVWFQTTRHLVGKVSLFNHLVYSVCLTQGYSGIWRPVQCGHHFNTDTMVVERMYSR